VLTSDQPTRFAVAVDAAAALIGGDMGNMQLIDPGPGALQLKAQCSFALHCPEFVAGVYDASVTCRQTW
jgi:hypothetical protein